MRTWLESLSPAAALTRIERLLLCLLPVVVLAFSVITVEHQALSNLRKGDLGVFFRAAWAAREGTSLYSATDDHGWHYHYPPVLAAVLIPLADPPPTDTPGSRPPALPYWLSCALWYWLNIGCIVAAMHLVASALEKQIERSHALSWPRYSRGWWALRVWPFLLCMFYIGASLARGQVTTIVLLCLSGCAASLVMGRSTKAGAWLGLAIGLKLYPAYLLIYPLLRRDRSFFLGAAGAVVLTIVLPFAIMGPSAAMTAYRELIFDRLEGEATGQINPVVAHEMHGTDAQIQSFQYVAYYLWDPAGYARKSVPPRAYLVVHAAVSLLLTIAALLAMRRRVDPLGEFLFFASLALLVVPIAPVSRPHYYAVGALAVAGIMAHAWSRSRGVWTGWGAFAVLAAAWVIELIVVCEQEQLVDGGAATVTALALIAFCIVAGRSRVSGEASP